MRLARKSDPRRSDAALLSYPISTETITAPAALALAKPHPDTSTSTPNSKALADLIDLVANHRSDLLPTLLDALGETESAREPAKALTDLVATSGVADSRNPCATAIAIAADLEKLASVPDAWTHPAQIVRHPHVQALSKLCAARIESNTGSDREQLKKIQPRLERAAKLTERAASRRQQEAERHQLR